MQGFREDPVTREGLVCLAWRSSSDRMSFRETSPFFGAVPALISPEIELS
jgi:hypothetical protein